MTHFRYVWKIRVPFIALVVVIIGISTGLTVVSLASWWLIVIIVLLQAYRVFGYLRVVHSKRRFEHARTASLRTELTLSAFLVVAAGLMGYGNLSVPWLNWSYVIGSVLVVVLCVCLFHVRESAKKTLLARPSKAIADLKLPSITVAIPARNENDDLSKSLMSVIASDYPKLEVLALDDCSQDKTSDIIRRFAHQGVRFLEGAVPPGSWLPKNFAYQQLLNESEGKYIVFSGTDVRFGPKDLRIIIETMVDQELKMLSILPIRESGRDPQYILQPMRYFRELVFPSILRKYPPAISTVWVIERQYLESVGGFSAFKKTIRPEKILAKSADLLHAYQFARSSGSLLLRSSKDLKAQWNTAVRTRYPENRNRPEYIFLSTVGYFFVFVGPALLCVYGFMVGDAQVFALGLLTVALALVIDAYVIKLTTARLSLFRLALLPVNIALEIFVLNYSMWAYEFSQVSWKGRNICLPVLRGPSRLPNIE